VISLKVGDGSFEVCGCVSFGPSFLVDISFIGDFGFDGDSGLSASNHELKIERLIA